MRYVVIPTFWLGQIADAYAQMDDAVEAALRSGSDCTLLEILGEATSDGHTVWKPFPQATEEQQNAKGN